MKNRTNVLLTLRSTKGKDLAETREALEMAGMVVEKVLPITKVVTGRVHNDKIVDLENLENVLSVREEGAMQLPPLDSEVPQ